MKEKGFAYKHTDRGTLYFGIALKQSNEGDES